MIVQLVMQAMANDQVLNIDEQTVLNHITVQAPGRPSAEEANNTIHQPAPEGRKVGRKELCPCGSCQKFKWCHSANRQTRYSGP